MTYVEIDQEIVNGAVGAALAASLDTHGQQKTPEEVEARSDSREQDSLYSDPQKRNGFAQRASQLGFNSATISTFSSSKPTTRPTMDRAEEQGRVGKARRKDK